MNTTSSLFSLDNLAVFERHGATIETQDQRHGCWINLPNGWTLSVQWGPCTYSSNRDISFKVPSSTMDVPPATEAEIAAWHKDGNERMVRWACGNTVQGWCSMDRVQHVLNLLAEDKLMLADDGWTDEDS